MCVRENAGDWARVPAMRRRGFGAACDWLVGAVACMFLLGAGCASSPVTNARLDRFDPTQGYRAANLSPGEHNSDSLLVILTFSGGGTRAASFAYGVLEQLRDTRVSWEGENRSLLDEVDVVSSVSGGSLPAAYYGLFGRRIFEDFPEKMLYKNIQGALVRRTLLPPDNLKMLSPFYTRTDILAREFDRRIFEGKTYADLLQKGQRPYLVINSTDMSSGTRFEFTQDQFDQLYSDLGSCHIGHAVAASAAFPGAFPPMAVRNYVRGQDYALPDWAAKVLAEGASDTLAYLQARNSERYAEPGRSYVHLTDGGVADNLGLLPVIFMLQRIIEGFGPSSNEFYHRAKTVLVLTVNAEAKRPRPWDMAQSPVSLFHSLFAAGTTPLSNFSAAQIEYMKLLIECQELKAQLRDEEGAGADHVPEIHFVEVSFDRASDPAERDALNGLPTSFVLLAGDVDRIRGAAGKILQEHPGFQAFLSRVNHSSR